MLQNYSKEAESLDLNLKLMKNADYILLHFTDMLGMLRGRTVPAEEAENVLAEGVGFDGSSLVGGVSIEESDMIMKPDPSTFTVCPYYFYDKSVVTFLCNIQRPDGKQFESDPRYLCQKTLEKTQKEGYRPTAAAELEFYLVKKDKKGEVYPVENHLIDKQRYFDIAPDRDVTEAYRMDLSNILSAMGIMVERMHHEVGSAQNEITFKYSNPLATSDSIVRYKFATKALADKKYSWTATFMPKPWSDRAGSGMHVHLGLFDQKTGKNLFYDANGYAHVSQKCRYFIGGILDHARALCAVVAPTVNSYKRLVPGFEAPVYVAWSQRNRSALVRIPAFSPENEKEARIEFRCPDALCNPYLAYTVIFEAGLDGIRKKIEPPEPVDMNIYHISEAQRKELGVKVLPSSLREALDEWENDDICKEAIGRENADKYFALKMKEWKEYQASVPKHTTKVTRWELEKYLYN
ncbi:MAG: type I glutamate--ammonia ligase [Candidatus Bathyarchaeia archaeon]|jgi:glutamine synthetase|nr:type I glutamate--ammonia ligase [Candidatus Bathyarchaeota archaeon A05DMB-4]MDH7594644.1 type I glutamate--ammonia ligase [Candidatus Bathyarchaeota archaeon]